MGFTLGRRSTQKVEVYCGNIIGHTMGKIGFVMGLGSVTCGWISWIRSRVGQFRPQTPTRYGVAGHGLRREAG